MSIILAILVIGVVAFGVIALFILGIYNGLVSKRIATESAWSQIDVQLKRRHDLIPNLVETVKGYAKHESETLQKVIQARNAAISASGSQDVNQQIQAENQLTGALRQVFALSESYPDLKANTNFTQLQQELAITEDKISAARQSYNEVVATYNTAREQVPGNIVAGFGNFPQKKFFEVDAAEAAAVKQAPKVSF